MKEKRGTIREKGNMILSKAKKHFSETREAYHNCSLAPSESKRKENAKIAKIFLIVALVSGLMISFLNPPLCTPDENVHFANVYDLSRGHFQAEAFEGKVVRRLPKNVVDFMNKYPVSLNGLTNPNRYSYLQMFYDSYETAAPASEEIPYVLPGSSNTGYGVAALTVSVITTICNILRIGTMNSPYNAMLFGRLGNLLFYAIVIYFAIKRAPHFNRLIYLIGLMPMSIFLGASLSYDAIIIPIALYYVALILDLASEKDKLLTSADIMRVLLCVGLLVELKKGVCAPLLLLLLTIPKARYGNLKRLLCCIAGAVVVGIICYIPNIINSRIDALAGEQSGVTTSNAANQIHWVLTHKRELPGLFLRTYETFFNGYVNMFWGVLGWIDTYFPVPVMGIGYFVLFFVAAYECCSFVIWRGRRWKNILCIMGTAVSIFGVFMAMYIYFTQAEGYYVIEGVQGRYLIPLFFPLLLSFSNPLLLYLREGKENRFDSVLTNVSTIWGFCCAAVSIFILIARYWI